MVYLEIKAVILCVGFIGVRCKCIQRMYTKGFNYPNKFCQIPDNCTTIYVTLESCCGGVYISFIPFPSDITFTVDSILFNLLLRNYIVMRFRQYNLSLLDILFGTSRLLFC